MNQNRLFRRTRWRLATWYVVVMGIILIVCETILYQAVAHAHRVTVDRELQSVAGTLHNGLDAVLSQPGQIEPAITSLLPDLCTSGSNCSELTNPRLHAVRAIYQFDYYVRLLDQTGKLVALAGRPVKELPLSADSSQWQNLSDQSGTDYRQITLPLHTQAGQDWGYIQVGRSLQDFESYVSTIKWILLLGWPLAMLLVAIGAWLLVGRSMQPIYQSYRQIQQFTGDAAHELRTPLAAIRATVESTLMMPTLDEAEARETLQTVGRQNQRLSGIVADLLTLSRLDRQLFAKRQLATAKETVSLNDLVSDVSEEIAALGLASEVVLETQFAQSKLLEVTGKAEQLYRLVTNLVANAIQYTPPGGKVTVFLERSRSDALIRITDTGIGIPFAEQERIFERFYRLQSDRSRYSGGSGLGLAIASAIAQTHGGSIDVQSKPGRGSTFTVRLPLANF